MHRLFLRAAPAMLALCGALHLPARADTLASEAQIRALTDNIMTQAGAGRIEDAYGLMSPYALVDVRALEAARANARSARMAIEARVGASVGYEFIRSEKVGDALIKMTYIEKTERQAIPWQFIFYKTPAGWGISNLSNGDDVDTLFAR